MMIEVLIDTYLYAKNTVANSGYSKEIEWQRNVSIDSCTESDFLRESAWVILNSGMRESVIRSLFLQISAAFHNWESAHLINDRASQCRSDALMLFGHIGKIDAILKIAEIVCTNGYTEIKRQICLDPIEYLCKFPYMGPATSKHLAKNIGINLSKPDRHLCRIAEATGFGDPDELCSVIQEYTHDNKSVVDIVLWRFATLTPNYESIFKMNTVNY